MEFSELSELSFIINHITPQRRKRSVPNISAARLYGAEDLDTIFQDVEELLSYSPSTDVFLSDIAGFDAEDDFDSAGGQQKSKPQPGSRAAPVAADGDAKGKFKAKVVDTAPVLFVKEEVPARSVQLKREFSQLSQKLKEDGVVTQTRGEPAVVVDLDDEYVEASNLSSLPGQTPDGSMISLTIHCPKCSKPLSVKVPGNHTVEEVIKIIIRAYVSERRAPPLSFPGNAAAYELRLVEEDDGTPDLDWPPLERSRPISKFGLESVALCEVEAVSPSKQAADAAKDDARDTSRDSQRLTGHRSSRSRLNAINDIVNENRARAASDGRKQLTALRIHLPDNHSTVLLVDGNKPLMELLPLLAKKRNVPNFDTQRYRFRLPQTETAHAGRHGLSADFREDYLDFDMLVDQLKTDEIVLCQRKFADMPKLEVTNEAGTTASLYGRTESSTVAVAQSTHMRPDPSSFLFNDATASMYKEFEVVKTNNRGKKQHRILGIDRLKIYTRVHRPRSRTEENETSRSPVSNLLRWTSGSKMTRHPETPISEVMEVTMEDRPTGFVIRYQNPDGSEARVQEYDASNPTECAEIVARIRYLKSRPQRTG
eukprot:GILK01003523.1.p1 GENE.GILK01003523.1~~GILK01003523.1.p1  ORF type:complete len:597 (+),score=59.64 GILK01003523.1:134-1924(+)